MNEVILWGLALLLSLIYAVFSADPDIDEYEQIIREYEEKYQ